MAAGVALFKYPHVEPIWAAYLTSFVDRHMGGKLERARDLFTQVRHATVARSSATSNASLQASLRTTCRTC